MSLIEGVGDEVTVVFAILVVIVVAVIAWVSTHTREIPFISVIVVELSRRSEGSHQGNTTNNSADVSPTSNTPDENPVLHRDTHVENIALPVSEHKHCIDAAGDNKADAVSASQSGGDESVSETAGSTIEQDSASVVNSLQDAGESGNQSVSSLQDSQSSGGNTEQKTSELRCRRLAFYDGCHDDVAQTENTDQSRESCRTRSDADSGGNDAVAGAAAVSNTESADEMSSEVASDLETQQIRIRLKYLNDSQRLVYTQPSQTVQEFRRTHFASELASNKLVRFIFNGQDLRNDSYTLQSYNIVDNSVVHCLITQMQHSQNMVQNDDEGDLDLGHLMLPLFGFILMVIWYLRFSYRQYFNAMSTLCLVGVTFLFFLGVVSSWQGHRRRAHLD